MPALPLFWLMLALATPFWLIGGLALLLVLPSWPGKLAAFWTLLPLVALWTSRWRPRFALASIVLAALLLLSLLWAYPFPRRQAVSASVGFPSVLDYLCNFVPESDLAELGVRLAYSGATRDRVLGVLRPLYAEMAADPLYDHLPHVVGSTASDIFLGGPGSPHYYAYVPPGEGPKGALIFYHGALGDFTAYLHFWRRWAQKRDWIVVCPNGGFGRWFTPQGEERALALFDAALADLPIDRNRVILAGMSNGGTAVTRLANQRPEDFGAMLLVCPVLESDQIRSATFLKWTREHPQPIVLEGSEDVNVTPGMVEAAVNAIEQEGGRCDYRLLQGHDHHLLFSASSDSYAAADQLAEELESRNSEPKDP